MRKAIIILFVMLFAGTVLAQDKNIKFIEVVKQLDVSNNTKLAVKNNWQNLKGSEVTWSARVVDVKGGRGKAQIMALHKNGKKYKGFNLVLTTFDMNAAAKLKIDQRIHFTGQLNKYKSKPGGLVILYLSEVSLKSGK